MKRMVGLSAAALLGMTASAWASGLCLLNHGVHCITPPPPPCPDCSCRCETGHRHCSAWKAEHAHKLIAKLESDCCCDRIQAAKHLGCRLLADYCCCPEVLDALMHALLCDPCWEVRKAASWSIMLQGARTETAVLALYVSSKLDPHYLVRIGAAESLDILLVCRQGCFTDLLKSADELIKQLRSAKFKPGTTGCASIFQAGCATCGLATTPGGQLVQAPASAQPGPIAPPAK